MHERLTKYVGRYAYRLSAMAILLLCAVGDAAAADQACKFERRAALSVEWRERSTLRGMRLVARDARWQLQNAAELGRIEFVGVCETCPRDQVGAFGLWFAFGDHEKRNLRDQITAAAVSRWMKSHGLAEHVRHIAKTGPVATKWGELDGFARVMTGKYPDGRSIDLIVMAVAKGCVSAWAYLSSYNEAPLSNASADSFLAAVAIEPYVPGVRAASLARDEFPLGDARKKPRGEAR